MVLVVCGLLALIVVAVIVEVSIGRLPADPLAAATHSIPDHGCPQTPSAADVDRVRFDIALRGYRPAEVDAHLDHLAEALAEREREVAASTNRHSPGE